MESNCWDLNNCFGKESEIFSFCSNGTNTLGIADFAKALLSALADRTITLWPGAKDMKNCFCLFKCSFQIFPVNGSSISTSETAFDKLIIPSEKFLDRLAMKYLAPSADLLRKNDKLRSAILSRLILKRSSTLMGSEIQRINKVSLAVCQRAFSSSLSPKEFGFNGICSKK